MAIAGKKTGPPKGTRYGGRGKGTPNHLTSKIKAAFEATFDLLQKDAGEYVKRPGHKALVCVRPSAALTEWAKRHPGDYYKIASRLIPVQITGEDGGPVNVAGTLQLYLPQNNRRVEPSLLPQAAGGKKARVKIRRTANKAGP